MSLRGMIASNLTGVSERFRSQFARTPRSFRAPGRINLIGEHTDYNLGFVLPAAIDLYTWVAIAPCNDDAVEVFSDEMNASVTLDLRDSQPQPKGDWSDYVRGVALMIQRSGIALQGAKLLIHSDVPIGSGLSSSAALEVSVAAALLGVSGQSLELVDIAKLCQRAENDFVGTRCGIMDQFVACLGRAAHALLLDCRTLESRPLKLPDEIALVVCNTMVKHEHAGGGYNARRSECEEGVRRLQRSLPQIESLRDVTAEQLEAHKPDLPEGIYRRCRHVITENERVVRFGKALERGDLATLRACMEESHRSLRDDFAVSCEELDKMVELASGAKGTVGARMTGGGFGGCTVNLVRKEEVESFKSFVRREYEHATGFVPEIYVGLAADGVMEVRCPA